MPVVMFKGSTAKSPDKRNAKELEEALRKGVEGAGGRVVCVHSSGSVAYGIIEGPHDYDGLLTVLSVVAEIVGEVISLLTGD
jgi:hypothetical protein